MRDTILTALKDDIIDYIKSSRSPYTSDIAEVRRGIHGHTDIVNKPFIGISMESESVKQELFDVIGTDQIRVMKVYVYAYTHISDDYAELHQLLDDLEYFLKHDFTYRDTTYVKDIHIIEGGINSSVGFLDLYLEIQYQSNK